MQYHVLEGLESPLTSIALDIAVQVREKIELMFKIYATLAVVFVACWLGLKDWIRNAEDHAPDQGPDLKATATDLEPIVYFLAMFFLIVSCLQLVMAGVTKHLEVQKREQVLLDTHTPQKEVELQPEMSVVQGTTIRATSDSTKAHAIRLLAGAMQKQSEGLAELQDRQEKMARVVAML